MKCPLFAMFQPFASRKQGISDYDCLEEECAWWNKGLEFCFIGQIATSLNAICDELQEIQDKMPHPVGRGDTLC